MTDKSIIDLEDGIRMRIEEEEEELESASSRAKSDNPTPVKEPESESSFKESSDSSAKTLEELNPHDQHQRQPTVKMIVTSPSNEILVKATYTRELPDLESDS